MRREHQHSRARARGSATATTGVWGDGGVAVEARELVEYPHGDSYMQAGSRPRAQTWLSTAATDMPRAERDGHGVLTDLWKKKGKGQG